MKGKRVGKKDANTKTTQRCVIEEETEVLDVKPFCCPPSSNRSTRQPVRTHRLARDPLMLPSSTKTSLDTLKGCGKCLSYQPLNDMEMER